MGAQISSLVFQPPEVSYSAAKKHLVWLRTKNDVSIPGFYIDRKAKVTILFSHGNAEDLGMIYEWFCEFSKELNVNLLAYDYEGYGKAVGTPTEQACYDDIDAAYNYLTLEKNVSPSDLVLYGRSLGSGPSCYLAERLQRLGVSVGGLVLQSPFLSVFRVAFNFRFTLPWDMFPNVDRIPNIECPIFAIHGTRDEVVPFWNGEGMFFAAQVKWRAKPYWVESCGHNNVETVDQENNAFFDKFREFLVDCVPAYRGQSKASASNAVSARDREYTAMEARDFQRAAAR